jgi:hypothetical protein
MPAARPSSSRLNDLLAVLWTSPVFDVGVSPALMTAAPEVIDRIYSQCVDQLDAALPLAWPELDAEARQGLINQLAPKSVAFCGALAAGEVDEVDRLSATAVAIALVYLADQTMDRGDEAMIQAIERVAGVTAPSATLAPLSPKVARYLALLGVIVEQVAVMARPEDRFELLTCLMTDTLVREARVARLNAHYLRSDPDQFWQAHAAEVAELVVMNGGFVAVAAMIYSVCRWGQPALPPLAEVLPGLPPIAAALRAGSAACRIYDDVGDRIIDLGATRWGCFALNPCNQRDQRFLVALADAAGIQERSARQAWVAAFAAEAHDVVLELTTQFVRQQYAAIPQPLAAHYRRFLTLTQRVVNAGRVNTVGDDQLVEQPLAQAVGAS